MTSEPKHTPGPWFVGALPPAAWRYICDSTGSTVAAVAEWDSEDGELIQEFGAEAKANAYLIAAAPELLEALERLVEGVQISEDVTGIAVAYLIDARNAIAKAKGK